LQPVTEARAPLWETTDDYNVVWVGEKVGRIYRHPACFEARQFGTPWYWGFGHPAFRVGASGHVATKEAALAAFRAAWDKLEIGQVPEQAGKHCPSWGEDRTMPRKPLPAELLCPLYNGEALHDLAEKVGQSADDKTGRSMSTERWQSEGGNDDLSCSVESS
jgi:hypothetical protein